MTNMIRIGKHDRRIGQAAVLLCAALFVGGCAGTSDEVSETAQGYVGDTGVEVSDRDRAEDNELATGISDTPESDREVTDIYVASMPTEPEVSDIFVSPVDGISDSFIRGMDVSSLLSEEASGVKYYDGDGREQDLFKILADSGINCIRVRVWNDPFDADGHGYGGGNCTADTAAVLGARAAAYGMDLCVDFHYSDFWADPNKQMRPKAWNNMRVNDQKQLVYDYTCESLRRILDAGAQVSMVQIGNEINYGLSGRTSFPDIVKLLKSGSEAVRAIGREYERDIKVCVHYTGIDDPEGIYRIADRLKESELDYDIFGVSYYPYWHGGMDNLTSVLKTLSSEYGVETCIMETAYMYTPDDGDGSGNSVSEQDAVPGYPISVQGQANCIRDVCASAVEGGALGVFYWEGAWIPVKPETGTNQAIWEAAGSGWASSFASEYDPDDAGKYYGGCSWDNQALFDFDGVALSSLDVFKYLKYGARSEKLQVCELSDIELDMLPGDELALPDRVSVIWNDPDRDDTLEVKWDSESLAGFDSSSTGIYIIPGTVDPAGAEVADSIEMASDGKIKIEAVINIANVNLVRDPSFEEDDHSAWTAVSSIDSPPPVDYQLKPADAHSGDTAFHFWDDSDMEFNIEQDIIVDRGGTYTAECFIQGGDFREEDTMVYLYIANKDQGSVEISDPVFPDGWVSWKNPMISGLKINEGETVTIGVHVTGNSNAWGTIDDFSLKME